MFKKKTKPETANVAAPEQQSAEFQKNIKTLWIYTSLFCLFALALILISSIIQGKVDQRAEYYQDQYENVQTSSQSTIQNIQTENSALKADIEKYKTENEFLREQFKSEEELLNSANEIIINAEYLLKAQSAMNERDEDTARAYIAKIDINRLTGEMRTVYDTITAELAE